jgi:hypothetical protein
MGELRMKRKNILILVILVVVSISAYIWVSTTFINQRYYSKRTYASMYKNNSLIDGNGAKVTLVKLKEEPCSTPPILKYKINRCLLLLNGGYAVRVEINTDMDDLLGPLIVYFNPFTKQPIGGVLRM